MPGPTEVDSDPTKPLEVNIAQLTHIPTVFAYRMWYRQPSEPDWTEFAKGDTRDQPPYHHEVAQGLPKDTKLIFKIAVGGHRNAKYHMVVTFIQDGRICPNGIISEQGTTTGNGSAVLKHDVTLV